MVAKHRLPKTLMIIVILGIIAFLFFALIIFWSQPYKPPIITVTSVRLKPTPGITLMPTVASSEYVDIDPAGNKVLMRLVPAGPFTMGSDSGDLDEKPVHIVELPSFYIDTYEVTNDLYQSCVNANVCVPPESTTSNSHGSYYGNPQFGSYPVIAVTWEMAKIYCEGRGARLPRETEWEKAARGNDGREYPWGNGIDQTFANYNNFSTGDTTEVGKYEKGKSPYGLYDMAGNVSEWTADWYEPYPGNPAGTPDYSSDFKYGTIYRVIRGGSWLESKLALRTFDRGGQEPSHSVIAIGFRCAIDATP